MAGRAWTIVVSGTGEQASIASILQEFLGVLADAGHYGLGHRITMDTHEVAPPAPPVPLEQALARSPGGAPSGANKDARSQASSYVLGNGGSLRTMEGVVVPLTPGSIATATRTTKEGSVLVAVARKGVHVGVGQVTLPDGSPLVLRMPG